MAKTRLSNGAQLVRAREEAVGESPVSVVVENAWSRSPGTICDRNVALGASSSNRCSVLTGIGVYLGVKPCIAIDPRQGLFYAPRAA